MNFDAQLAAVIAVAVHQIVNNAASDKGKERWAQA